MNQKVKETIDLISSTLDMMEAAEKKAEAIMKKILSPCGIDGIRIAPEDSTGAMIKVPVYEPIAQLFWPIVAIRYYEDKLEVYIQSYHPEDGAWVFDDTGKWIPYKAGMTDTRRLLSDISGSIEYADGYQDCNFNQQ